MGFNLLFMYLLSDFSFSLPAYPALAFSFFQPTQFTFCPCFCRFCPPLAIIQPLIFCTFTHPWQRFAIFPASVVIYTTLGLSLLSTLGYPLVFSCVGPWLLFSSRFSNCSQPFGYYSGLGFLPFMTLYYSALGLH